MVWMMVLAAGDKTEGCKVRVGRLVQLRKRDEYGGETRLRKVDFDSGQQVIQENQRKVIKKKEE